jgi:CDP-glycerol glycerophosphotransferase (TagB/SpsB family)
LGNGGRSKVGQKPWPQEVAEQSNVAVITCSGKGIYDGLMNGSRELHSNPKKAFLIAGSPKLKNLADGEYDRASILSSLGLDPSRKTILVSSHWTEMSLLRDLDTSVVQLLQEWSKELNIIVTAHPKLWELTLSERGFDGQALLRRLQSISKQYPDRLRISQSGNPFDLMAASDVLLCDHSSIRVEFSLLERPAGLYRNKNFICESKTTDELYRSSSEVFHDISSLELVLEKILSPHYENSKSIRDLRNFFIMNPSKGAEKIVNFLAECGRVSSPESSRWKRIKRLEDEHLIKDLQQR